MGSNNTPSGNRRFRILNTLGGRCWYCGDEMVFFENRLEENGSFLKEACIDHVLPESRGGTSNDDNLVPCCRGCNTSKRNKTLDEWREFLCVTKKPMFGNEQKRYLLHFGIDVDAIPDEIKTGADPVFYFEKLGLSMDGGAS